MSVKSKRLNNDEPIVLFEYEGVLDLEIFKQVLQDNVKWINEIGAPIYIVSDVRNMKTTFMDMLSMMNEAQKEQVGGANDDSIKLLAFVGTSAFIRMFNQTMESRGASIGIQVFETVDDALSTIRTIISDTNDSEND